MVREGEGLEARRQQQRMAVEVTGLMAVGVTVMRLRGLEGIVMSWAGMRTIKNHAGGMPGVVRKNPVSASSAIFIGREESSRESLHRRTGSHVATHAIERTGGMGKALHLWTESNGNREWCQARVWCALTNGRRSSNLAV